MYEGTSFLEVYREKSCINKLPTNAQGEVVLSLGAITDNALMPYTFPVWVKNIGTHNAYSVSAEITSSTIPCTSTKIVNEIPPSDVAGVLIDITNIPANFTGEVIVKLTIRYSNI